MPAKIVQRSVAAAVSAAPAPSVHGLTRGFLACCLSPSRDPVGVCSVGQPPECPGSSVYGHASSNPLCTPTTQCIAATSDTGQSFISRSILCHAKRPMRVSCNPGRICPIETAVKREVPPNHVDIALCLEPGLLCALVRQGKLLVDATRHLGSAPRHARRYCSIGSC